MTKSVSLNDCRNCGQLPWIDVMTLRTCDGDVHDVAVYCRECALGLLEHDDMGVAIDRENIGTTLDECYRSGCDRGYLPARPVLCEACMTARLADVRVTCVPFGSDLDLDKGTYLCLQCAVRGFHETGLPEKFRKELIGAIFVDDRLLLLKGSDIAKREPQSETGREHSE